MDKIYIAIVLFGGGTYTLSVCTDESAAITFCSNVSVDRTDVTKSFIEEWIIDKRGDPFHRLVKVIPL